MEKTVDTMVANEKKVAEKTAKNERILTQKMLAKSQITKADLSLQNGFIPTRFWFTRSDRGYYTMSFTYDTYMCNGEEKKISSESEVMPTSEMDLLISALNIGKDRLKKFLVKGYLRIVNVKGSKEDDLGNIRNYDFFRYEMFVVLENEQYADIGVFYHRPMNRRTGKPRSIDWAIAQNFKINSHHPYFVVESIESEDDDENTYSVN